MSFKEKRQSSKYKKKTKQNTMILKLLAAKALGVLAQEIIVSGSSWQFLL